MKNPTKEQLEAWHKDPNNWKCGGLFYYNKEDERLFPPKRVVWDGLDHKFANPNLLVLFCKFCYDFNFCLQKTDILRNSNLLSADLFYTNFF